MKKLLVVLIIIPFVLSCSQYQKVLKSTDYELKYSKAMEYYEKEDYMRAATLLNELQGVYRGTDKAESITYTYANCLYGLNDYLMGGHYYRQFVKTYPTSDLNEECQFMSAYCYYMQSPKARLDQTDTYNAINEFQLFVNIYPSSSRVEEANRLMDELRDKLVYKSYLNARLYFDLGNYMGNNYMSAVIAAQNSLKEFPDTKYREELSFLILEAKYIQAANSVFEKKEARMREAIDEYFSFINEFPESEYTKRAVKIFDEASAAIDFKVAN
ncbi:outer membrane protein assembly factor BamD [Labilibacter sediminis]|nr:outer membrane protein assembly factor BamD [Labilibacter sediminis]